jgi:glycosyltransferase involved in cell wall biosynthesis
MDQILPRLGLMVLTSISEGLPLVVLEGYAAGVPVVSTDVGSCRELIEGRTEEDRALGAAGRVVPIADPEATAEASLELLTDEQRWREAQQAGIRRVEAYYDQPTLFKNYREIYRELLEVSAGRHRL